MDSLLNLYVLIFSEGTKHMSTLYVISPKWYDTGSWNPSSRKTYIFYTVNSMAADVLARSQGIRNDDIDLVKPR